MNRTVIALVALGGVALAALSSVFIVDERERVLVLQFGEIVQERTEPGLGFKVPFLQDVVRYDDRILALPTQPLEVTLADDRRLVVDAFVRWRITDLRRFRTAVGGGGIDFARQRIDGIVNTALQATLGQVPSTELLSEGRTALMNSIRDQAKLEAASLGVDLIDVRLTRTDQPELNLEATFDRMRAEREREAADEIARGNEAAQRVRATADRTVVELTSDARRQSNVIRGEADAERNAIYAEAFGQDPEFFAFTRSLTSYEAALRGTNSSIVMQPDSAFFQYLRSYEVPVAPEAPVAPVAPEVPAVQE
jgi:modulator of FtsH protease HflC